MIAPAFNPATIAVWGQNTLEFIVTASASSAAAPSLVPINTRFKGDEAAYVLRAATPVFTVRGFLETDYLAMLRPPTPRSSRRARRGDVSATPSQGTDVRFVPRRR